MNFRKLRIAWSVGCGALCLLLILLWVRSYEQWDELTGTSFGRWFTIRSLRGELALGGGHQSRFHLAHFTWDSYGTMQEDGMDGIRHGSYAPRPHFVAPHLLFVTVMLALAAVPLLPKRFSLRTMLIGMTVVAIGLGWVVYVFRG